MHVLAGTSVGSLAYIPHGPDSDVAACRIRPSQLSVSSSRLERCTYYYDVIRYSTRLPTTSGSINVLLHVLSRPTVVAHRAYVPVNVEDRLPAELYKWQKVAAPILRDKVSMMNRRKSKDGQQRDERADPGY